MFFILTFSMRMGAAIIARKTMLRKYIVRMSITRISPTIHIINKR